MEICDGLFKTAIPLQVGCEMLMCWLGFVGYSPLVYFPKIHMIVQVKLLWFDPAKVALDWIILRGHLDAFGCLCILVVNDYLRQKGVPPPDHQGLTDMC